MSHRSSGRWGNILIALVLGGMLALFFIWRRDLVANMIIDLQARPPRHAVALTQAVGSSTSLASVLPKLLP